MTYEEISCERKGNLTEIKLQRPEKHNALTTTMIGELRDAFSKHRTDPETRAITLTGSGKSFCAGADVTQFGAMLGADGGNLRLAFRNEIVKLHSIISDIQRTPKPIVAGVNGAAAGAGLSLAIACDIVLISDEAFMTFAYTRIGLPGDGGSTYFLPRTVGTRKALNIALRSPRIGAREAVDMGLASEVIPSEDFEEKVREVGTELADGPTVAYGMTKRLLRRSLNRSLEDQLKEEEEAMVKAFETSDFVEGVRAFLKKEPPKFEGK